MNLCREIALFNGQHRAGHMNVACDYNEVCLVWMATVFRATDQLWGLNQCASNKIKNWQIASVINLSLHKWLFSQKKKGENLLRKRKVSFEIQWETFQDVWFPYIGTQCPYVGKGKSAPLQAWSDPERSRKLRFPDFVTTAQDGGKVVSVTHRLPLPLVLLLLISVRGWVDSRAIVRSEGFYVNEKFQWHQLGSNHRPSDL